MPPKGVKGFFRQKKKKKTGAISKPKTSKNSLPPKHGASQLDLQDDDDMDEEVLRQFDMNMAYGPCIGMSRIDRWERANKLGMNPPKDVELLLRAGKVRGNPFWDGRLL